ncbi:proline dehydrogenase, partial [Streptomyces sp. NPDC007000]|uniref:proline dehydrogenase n=1 Tax=Streptomyces sp. NPDC007000 TaxID=3155357 RepID=UPI00340DC488
RESRAISLPTTSPNTRNGPPKKPTDRHERSRLVALARQVHRAAEVVILEGPVSLEEVAERVAHASSDLSLVMRRMAENAHAGDTTHKAEDTVLAAERERILYQAVKDFRLAARSVIGNTK